jgi:uncharacterized protein (TIGR02145 family)
MKSSYILAAIVLLSSLALKAQTIMNIHQNNGTVLQIPLNTIDSITYTNSNPGVLATINTLQFSNIDSTSVTCAGYISNDGGSTITQRGFVYSTTPNPTTANNQTNTGTGIGSYTTNISGLASSTTYYCRAYAINSAGTAYGNELSFITLHPPGAIVSNPGAGVTFDGYNYTSVILGNGQEWLTENLRTTIYANGDPIPNVTSPTQWDSLTTGAWAHYNNNTQFETPYGKLYNWYTVADSRNICPTGWHVPSYTEMSTFTNYLDPNSNAGTNVSTAGGKMKSTGTQNWTSPNTDATNESGFSGLPGGYINPSGTSASMFGYGNYWTSTEESVFPSLEAWSCRLNYNSDNVNGGNALKGFGLSVRCVKD